MALTDTAIKKLKAADKPLKVSDERGLYLLVKPQGARLWRWKYRHAGKEKLMALGGYPDVSLAQAREKREEGRKLLAAGVDPMGLWRTRLRPWRASGGTAGRRLAQGAMPTT